MLWCPAQTVTGGSVKYNRADQPTLKERVQYGWKVVGTIHSHCDFSAFHSGVDTDDEADFDGLHITLGHVNRNAFSMVSSAAINANRIGYDPSEVAEVVQTGSEDEQPKKHWKVATRQDKFFVPVLEEGSEAEQAEDLQLILDGWMPKVTSGWKGGNNGKKTKSGGSNSIGFQPYDWSDFDDSLWKQGGDRDEPVDKWWKNQP
jgi:proteasome lid subunit RPN8/RPN11